MHKTFTTDDLLLLAYNDPMLEDREELRAEITFCNHLQEKSEQIAEIKQQLDTLIDSAPGHSISSLMNFSRSLSIKDSVISGEKVIMILN
ncbi:MAG: hypothetical protein ACK4GL_00370 [Flavobacteriales bacterium]